MIREAANNNGAPTGEASTTLASFSGRLVYFHVYELWDCFRFYYFRMLYRMNVFWSWIFYSILP